MDAPAMVMRKHVPEDVGLRNIADERTTQTDEEGGQQQQLLHRDDKEHKPVLKKVKEKVKKIKNTIAGQGHNGGERGGGGSRSSDEDEGEVVQREAEMEKGGNQEDVEDKPVVMESDPEVHGAPMYDSVRIPAVQEVEGDDAPKVRLGDLGGPVIEDPAAPRSTTPAGRGGEDIGTTTVVRAFESMTVSDDPPHVGAGKRDVIDEPKEGIMPVSDAGGEEWKDAATDATTDGGATYTDKIKSAAAGTTEYGKKLATAVYQKVAGVGTAVAGKVQQATQSTGTATPGVGAQGTAKDDSSTTATPRGGGPGNGQDKGVTVTGYIAEQLRPGDEDRALSEAIAGAVQRRKEEARSTVAQRLPAPSSAMAKAREAPAQAMAKAREAVTSLTGGNRVSKTVQPTTEGDVKEGVAVEGPVLDGEEIGGANTNTNTNIM